MLPGPPQILAQINAALHRGPRLYGITPPGDVRKLSQILTEWLRDQHPRPRDHIGNRILVENERASLEPSFEHAQTTVVFTGVALVGVAVIGLLDALCVVHEMTELSCH